VDVFPGMPVVSWGTRTNSALSAETFVGKTMQPLDVAGSSEV
jgi:hypothetical protein